MHVCLRPILELNDKELLALLRRKIAKEKESHADKVQTAKKNNTAVRNIYIFLNCI